MNIAKNKILVIGMNAWSGVIDAITCVTICCKMMLVGSNYVLKVVYLSPIFYVYMKNILMRLKGGS